MTLAIENEGPELTKDTEMSTEQEEEVSVETTNKEIIETKTPSDTNSQATCNCSVIDRQQREIVNLKRKLQEREVYGSPTKAVQEQK